MRGRKGYISLFVLLSGMILLILTLSLLTRQVNEGLGLQSFRHRVQAHYLAESGMDMALWQLWEWNDAAMEAYEESLWTAIELESAAPSLNDCLRTHVMHQLYRLNAFDKSPMTNLFDELTQPHAIRMKAEPSICEGQVTLTVMGTYGRARVTQRAVAQMPHLSHVEDAEGGGSEWVIRHMTLVSRSQIVSDW